MKTNGIDIYKSQMGEAESSGSVSIALGTNDTDGDKESFLDNKVMKVFSV